MFRDLFQMHYLCRLLMKSVYLMRGTWQNCSHFIGYNVFGEGLNLVPPTPMTTHYDLQGIGTRDDIDKTLKLGMNHPMGPLQLGKH